MKLLYNLTKEQMADVYEEYQDYLYKGDIEAIFENLENADDIKLTDEEIHRHASAQISALGQNSALCGAARNDVNAHR